MSPLENSTAIRSDRLQAANLPYTSSLRSSNHGAKLSPTIACCLPGLVSAIALLSASSALALPADPSAVYGKGMVLQAPDNVALPDSMKFSGSQVSMGSDRFLGIEAIDSSKLTITSWKTELPVTMPNGQAAVATFYGSPDHPMATPGIAVQRGFTPTCIKCQAQSRVATVTKTS